jgi:hypothetical protein
MIFETQTFGPTYVREHDEHRLQTQLERVRAFMLKHQKYHTLAEIQTKTGDPAASISAQLRHLRKPKFGSFVVHKRRRGAAHHGIWEYRVFTPQ